MTAFIHDEFLLDTSQARELYHDFAEEMPIIDYHCHLSPAEIAGDKRWENITRIWLYGDHYKWRAMRSNGVSEQYCTGDASDREKFDKFAETMPYLLRNPIYHWSHLELARYFGISDLLLNPDSADEIWDRTAERLAEPDMSARGLIEQSNVVALCTTDDPADPLDHHRAIAADDSFNVRVLPAWRPDAGMAVEEAEQFNSWLEKLAAAANVDIRDFGSFMTALRERHDFFHRSGCRLSDHGVETVLAEDYTASEVAAAFEKVRSGQELEPAQVVKFKSAMMYEFGVMDAEKNWVQQIHYGALRNNSSRMLARVGANTGFDCIGDWPVAAPLVKLMDRLDAEKKLPRTIVYTMNPRDNEVLAAMIGSFQDDSVPGKIQLGSGWWFNDQKDGMERQMEALSLMGLLSRFVGMLTDSRSFLSYTRHEYFRRILCNMLGNDMAAGLIPADMALAGGMVRDICYNNAAGYFGFDV